jgi:hypothetical protein
MKKDDHQVINSIILAENEYVARRAYDQGELVLCFLLTRTLIESLLRAFLNKFGNESFNDLIIGFENFMKSEGQKDSVFIKELTKFNRQRNKVIHQLWKNGYSATNEKLEIACRGAFIVYGLLIEWLETFDPTIIKSGFDYDKE